MHLKKSEWIGYLRQVFLTFMLGLLPPMTGLAQVQDQTTVREQCRKAVSGAILQARDNYDRTERYHILIVRSAEENSKALAVAERDLKAIRIQAKKVDFDIPLSEEVARLESLTSTLTAQRDDLKAMEAKAKADFSKTKSYKAALDAQFGPVFELIKVDNGTEQGYPFRVKYRSDCPKYSYLCPLPAKQAAALRGILVENGAPAESCKRYSQILSH